jgi:hypothetical protein
MKPEKKILYFIRGSKPTAEESNAVAALGRLGNVCLRCAALAEDDAPETCDAVAGLVPDRYKNAAGIVWIGRPEAKPEGKPDGKPPTK